MKDYCIACHQPLQKLKLGKGVISVMVCTNSKCQRVGLLTVAGVRLVKKEVGKNEIRTKSADKPNRKKG